MIPFLSRFFTTITSLFLLCSCSNPKTTIEENQVTLRYQKKSQTLSNTSKDSLIWDRVTRQDPNSGQTLTYSGYYLKDIIPKARESLGIDTISNLKITAKDGYIIQLPWIEIEKIDAFLALEVSGQSPKGIYNNSLKKFFDWRPGYLIFLKKSKTLKTSSPYQIVEIEFENLDSKKSFLNDIPKTFKQGAQIFLKTCNKCHSHNGRGGMKAPAISALTNRWKSDSHLKTFLRAPQKTLGRNIEMSAFTGSDPELEVLVDFLRSIEIKY